MGWSKNILVKIGLGLLAFYALFLLSKNVSKSFYLLNQDKINLVIFQKEPVFIAYDLKDKNSYLINFYPDLKVQLPGGYGEYRLGGLLKLSELDKKPEIIQRTFSNLTKSLVDFYFYPDQAEIYFGKNNNEKANRISFFGILRSKSNASFFERILVYFLLLRQDKSQQLSSVDMIKSSADYQGYFYKESLRKEKINAQLVYKKSYPTALNLSKILEGEGIRIVDILQKSNEEPSDKQGKCLIVQSSTSQTANYLARYFKCDLKTSQQTGVYDLVFNLNNLEDSWEIN